jgi:hypothetical protein
VRRAKIGPAPKEIAETMMRKTPMRYRISMFLYIRAFLIL